MPGNPLVRFDEGRVGRTRKVSPSLLLYWPMRFSLVRRSPFVLYGQRVYTLADAQIQTACFRLG